MIETGGGLVSRHESTAAGRPNIYTDSEVDKAVEKHSLFPKLTQQKESQKVSVRSGQSRVSPTSQHTVDPILPSRNMRLEESSQNDGRKIVHDHASSSVSYRTTPNAKMPQRITFKDLQQNKWEEEEVMNTLAVHHDFKNKDKE